MTDAPKLPAPGAVNPIAAPAKKGRTGFDPASLKGKGKGPKGPAPGKRIALPGKARGR